MCGSWCFVFSSRARCTFLAVAENSFFMSFSRHSQPPDKRADILGWLEWEYDRLRVLTRLPSSAFHYDIKARTEVEKGATSAAFCFHLVHGDEFARLCTMAVDGRKTKLDCIRRYISPLRRVQEALLQRGCLPHSAKLKPADSCDEHMTRTSTLQVMYLAHVLLGWFERARAVLVARIEGRNLNSIMSVTPFVSENRRAQAAWDWADSLVRGHRRSHAPGSAPVPARMQLLMDWVDGTPRPVVNVVDPGDWSFDDDVGTTDTGASGRPNPGEGGAPPSPTAPPDPTDQPGSPDDSTEQGPAGEGDDQQNMSETGVAVDDDGDKAEEREAPQMPKHAPSTAQDMSAIGGVDLVSLFFTDLPMITCVPTEYWEQWARANTVVYDWVLNSTPGTVEHDNALFWELLIHKMLLRRAPKSRGKGRVTRDSVAARFHAFATGDFQFLVQGLVKACNAAKARKKQFNANDESTIQGRVEKLLTMGRFSKAFRLLDSKGQADLGDAGVVRQLNNKHGPRMHQLPGVMPQGLEKAKFNIKTFTQRYRDLKPLSGVGPDGYRYEYLSCLAATMTCPNAASAVKRHKEFGELFVNAELPAWYYWIATATKMIALIKAPPTVEGGTPDVRPIGMGACKRRAWTSCLMKDNANVFKQTFWSVQVAVAVKAGVPKLIFGTTEHMTHNKNHVLLKLDFTNAFNTVWRSAVLKACLERPEWRHLYRFFWCTLSPKSRIVGIDATSDEGMQQGDSAGSTGFCMPLQKLAEWANNQLKAVGGRAAFDMDDGYMYGPIETVMQVVREFQCKLQNEVGAELNPSKCKLWCHREHRTHVNEFLAQHGITDFAMGFVRLPNTGRKAYGVKVSGVPFGDGDYVKHCLKVKVNEVVSQIKDTVKRLQHHSCQNLYALLVQCLHSKLQFWLQCMRPEVLDAHLGRFDKVMLSAVRVATGQKFAKDGSLPFKRLRLPRRLGGGMIRSARDLAPAAFVGGICLCVPCFTRSTDAEGTVSEGFLDHMSNLYGVGSFDAGREETRFAALLAGGSPLGGDLRKHFGNMKSEVHGSVDLECVPLWSPFKLGAQGAGVVRGEVVRRTQHAFTEARENERARRIVVGLRHKLTDRNNMPARDEAAFLSVNRLSCQFVGLPKMKRTVMDNQVFKEVWSIYMGTASPVCKNWIGTSYVDVFKNRRLVDEFGDNVAAAMMPGDGWRTRHDSFKWLLAQQATWAMYQLRVEPNNLFLPWIQQREAFMAQVKARKRQGMVPDFLDVKRQVLMDVKGCSFCKTRYQAGHFHLGQQCKGVRVRQDEVHTSSVAKMKKVDRVYNGWDRHSTVLGPAAQRLRGFGRVEGLVVGAHGEGSPDLLKLIKRIAKRAAETNFRTMGFNSSRGAYSTVLDQIYLSLGVESIRGMARLRFANLGSALAGSASNKAAAARRNRAKHLYYEQCQAYFARQCYYDI